MEKIKFSLQQLQTLYDNGQLKDHLDAKNYVSKYFYASSDGTILMWDRMKDVNDRWFFQPLKFDTFNNVYGKRFPPDIFKWFQKENKMLYDVVCNVNGSIIDNVNLTINCAGQFLHIPFINLIKNLMRKSANLLIYSFRASTTHPSKAMSAFIRPLLVEFSVL